VAELVGAAVEAGEDDTLLPRGIGEFSGSLVVGNQGLLAGVADILPLEELLLLQALDPQRAEDGKIERDLVDTRLAVGDVVEVGSREIDKE